MRGLRRESLEIGSGQGAVWRAGVKKVPID